MVDSVKITILTDIGANIAYNTLVPVVNMEGDPLTQKSTLQNVGNLILGGAGGPFFPRAAQANLALSVANAAQPNITSVGTLTSLSVLGTANVGNLVSSTAKTIPVLVSELPSAATAGMGARAFVTDANDTAFNAPAVGGGSNSMPVFSNGTGWFIG